MKTTLFTFLFAVTLLLQPLNAQTTSYLPVFGDTTRYYYWIEIDDGAIYGYNEYAKVNDSILKPVEGTGLGVKYDLFLTNSTNSKVWGIDTLTAYKPAKRVLVMDLDLNVGDEYIDESYYGYMRKVDSVYWKNGRKHIRFEKDYMVENPVGAVHFLFIEGVGTSTCFGDIPMYNSSNSYITWLRSQYKNGELAYGVPEWYPLWDYVGDDTGTPDIKTMGGIRYFPSPTQSNLEIILSQDMDLVAAHISVTDTSGRLIRSQKITDHRFSLDVNELTSGIYFLQITTALYKETVKFIKV